MTAGGHGPEAVQLGAGQMLEGVLAAARVQGVAVGQEGHTALLLAPVSYTHLKAKDDFGSRQNGVGCRNQKGGFWYD